MSCAIERGTFCGRALCRGMLLLCLFVLCGCRDTILHDLSEEQANRVWVVLSKAGIGVEKTRENGTWSIEVDSSDATEALIAIEQSRCLKDSAKTLPQSSGSLIPSREERNYHFQRNLALSLERTFESLPRVLEARVHLRLVKDNSLGLVSENKRQSAGVLLLTEAGDAIAESKVKRLVSGATGVSMDAISVVIADGVSSFNEAKEQMATVAKSEAELLEVGSATYKSFEQQGLAEDTITSFASMSLTAKVSFALLASLFFFLLLNMFFKKTSASNSVDRTPYGGKGSSFDELGDIAEDGFKGAKESDTTASADGVFGGDCDDVF